MLGCRCAHPPTNQPLIHPPTIFLTHQVVEELARLGVAADAIDGILAALAIRTVADLEALLGADTPAVSSGCSPVYGQVWMVGLGNEKLDLASETTSGFF